MGTVTRDLLSRQFDIAWQLTSYHLEGLTTEECLWRPADRGLHVRRGDDGLWRGDWPDHEGYDLGPPSLGWLTWHLCFWWAMALDHTTGEGTLTREQVTWPGSADGVRAEVQRCEREWRALLAGLDDVALGSAEQTRWPFRDRPLADLMTWATVELTKNAAEIGAARFHYAVRPERQ